MIIKLPKGFLDKLSKSTRKELESVASTFEVEAVIEINDDWRRSEPPPISTDPKYRYVPTYHGAQRILRDSLRTSNTHGKQWAVSVGFQFQEADFVPPEYKRAAQFELDSYELTALKKSIGSIKKVLGDV